MIRNFTLLTFSFFVLGGGIANAQWNQDTSVRNQIASPYYKANARILHDGQGGFFVSYLSVSPGYPPDFMVQRMDSDGYALWTTGGKLIVPGSALNYVSSYGLATAPGDSSDGYVVWAKHIPGPNDDLYVQRYDNNGNVLFGTSGIHLGSNPAYVLIRSLFAVADDSGGVTLVCVRDPQSTSKQIQAQRVDRSGTTHFPLLNYVGPYGLSFLDGICSDQAGGVFYFYETNDSLLAGHFNKDGNDTWAAAAPLSDYTGTDSNFAFVKDPASNGCFVVMHDTVGMYIQHIDSSGALRWNYPGAVVCDENAASGSSKPEVAADGSGGAYVCYDHRAALHYDTLQYILKHYDAAGNSTINTQDTLVIMTNSRASNMHLISDNSGGAIVTWEEARYNRICIFAQRYDANGTKMWRDSGFPVSTSNAQGDPGCNYQCYAMAHKTIDCEANAAVVAWQDNRSTASYYGIYLAKIDGTFTSGVEENFLTDESFSLSPNPAQDFLEVWMSDDKLNLKNLSLSIINILGEHINCTTTLVDRKIIFDVAALPTGVYMLRVQNGTMSITKKFIRM